MKLLPPLVAALIGASVTAQNAFTVIDQQPNQNGASVADLDAPQRLADGFKSKGAGEIITHFTIWGCWAGTMPAADTFQVGFHETGTLFGLYDVPLEPAMTTITGLAPVSVTATGNMINGYSGTAWGSYPEYELLFVLPQPVTTTPGCVYHWMSLASENSPGAYFNWGSGNASANGNSSQYANYSQPSGTWSPPVVFNIQDLALKLEAVSNGLSMCATNLVSDPVATNTWTLEVTDGAANSIVAIGASTAGGGPVPTPWGNVMLTPPIIILPFIITDANGNGSVSMPMGPGVAGAQLWMQGLDITLLSFSNPIAATIG